MDLVKRPPPDECRDGCYRRSIECSSSMTALLTRLVAACARLLPRGGAVRRLARAIARCCDMLLSGARVVAIATAHGGLVCDLLLDL